MLLLFFSKNCRFCAVEKNYKYLQLYCKGNIKILQLEIFKNMKKWITKIINWNYIWTFSTTPSNLVCIWNYLVLNCRMFEMKTLYQIVKDSIITPLISAIKTLTYFKRTLSIQFFFSWQLSTIDFHILTKYMTSHNRKSL